MDTIFCFVFNSWTMDCVRDLNDCFFAAIFQFIVEYFFVSSLSKFRFGMKRHFWTHHQNTQTWQSDVWLGVSPFLYRGDAAWCLFVMKIRRGTVEFRQMKTKEMPHKPAKVVYFCKGCPAGNIFVSSNLPDVQVHQAHTQHKGIGNMLAHA